MLQMREGLNLIPSWSYAEASSGVSLCKAIPGSEKVLVIRDEASIGLMLQKKDRLNIVTLSSLCLDLYLANNSAVFVILFANKSSEIRAAYPDWKEPLGDKLRFDLGYLHRRGEPVCEL
jgi:hypothetical protein